MGTPYSDATEEKEWRKLLHRATFVRKRDPKLPDRSCRHRCGEQLEGMLHHIQCPAARPFWGEIRRITRDLLHEPPPDDEWLSIVFGISGSTRRGGNARFQFHTARQPKLYSDTLT